MDAAARVESERIKAANEKMLEPLAKQIDADLLAEGLQVQARAGDRRRSW